MGTSCERYRTSTPCVRGTTGPASLVLFVYSQFKGTVLLRLWGTVQIRTEGVRKCRSLQIVVHGMANWCERSRSRTAGVQSATRSPRKVQFVYTQPNAVVIVGHVGGIQIRTRRVQKCRSLQVVAHGMVNCRERSWSRTPAVQCATRPTS